jgi:hypothetical protein
LAEDTATLEDARFEDVNPWVLASSIVEDIPALEEIEG